MARLGGERYGTPDFLGPADHPHQHAVRYGVLERGDLWTRRCHHQVQGRGRR